MGTHTISGMVPFVIAQVGKAHGLDPAHLLRGTGLEADKPPAAEAHVDALRYYEVWRRMVEAVGPSAPFDVASAFQLEDHEVFGFLAISCATLGQAYERTAAVRALYCVGARWELEDAADATRLIWYPWPGEASDPGYHAANELAMADMVDAIRRLGRTAPMPTAIRTTSPTTMATPRAQAFYGTAPSYAARMCELVYPPKLGDIAVASANPRLRDYFDDVCRQLVSSIAASDSMVARVRKELIATMDGGDPAMETIAKKLGTSSRSLQRYLAEEGTKFNDLLAEVRVELAKRYLTRGTVSASEVAYLVGFTEPPAFFKAFKRWTGMTPREYQLSNG